MEAVKMDYNSPRWKQKRAVILKLDGYIDQVAKRYGRKEEATHVHHIYPAAEYPQYRFATWNLISVSMATHNQLEDRVNGQLTELGMELQRRTAIGVDWRKKPYRTG